MDVEVVFDVVLVDVEVLVVVVLVVAFVELIKEECTNYIY